MRLVDSNWLEQHLGESDLLILDARGDPQRPGAHPLFDRSASGGYRVGHVPGAVPLRLREEHAYDSRPEPFQRFVDEIERAFGGVGVRGDETVVVYDEDTGSWGPRIGFLLEYVGHLDVRVLDGGWNAWVEYGGPVSQAPATPIAAPPFHPSTRDETFASADWIRAHAGEPGVVILDVRSENEYHGRHQSEPESRPGRVPGATHLDWHLLSEGGRFRSKADRLAALAARGVTPEREVVVYCQRAARAANAYLALQDLGFPRLRTYLGSWRDWGARDDLPREVTDDE